MSLCYSLGVRSQNFEFIKLYSIYSIDSRYLVILAWQLGRNNEVVTFHKIAVAQKIDPTSNLITNFQLICTLPIVKKVEISIHINRTEKCLRNAMLSLPHLIL